MTNQMRLTDFKIKLDLFVIT